MNRLFLIDGHALVFKMYYAFLGRPMMNSKGVDTSILFGFVKYLLDLVEREHPSHLAVSFDPPGGTFRNQLYPAYKANRPETPPLVVAALEPLTQILSAMGIPVLMEKGFEADDVIGSMAKRSASEGFTVYMVTPDKDYGQLVEERIIQYKPGKAAENELLDVQGVCGKWDISSPQQVIDILALCGDSADNVPGVQGIGPKGAAKLLARYGSVENIYSHIEELTTRQKEQFRAASDHIALSKTLVTIRTDLPLSTTAEQMILPSSMSPEVFALFDEYEFPSLKRRLAKLFPGSGAAPGEPAEDSAPVCDLGDTVCVCFSSGTVCVAGKDEILSGSAERFRSVLEDENTPKAGFAMKTLLKDLHSCGISLRGRLLDVELMHYLLNPERSHSLENISSEILGVEIQTAPTAGTASLFDEPELSTQDDLSLRAKTIRDLASRLLPQLFHKGLQDLYDNVEEPLLRVLADMEITGVKVDLAALREYSGHLRERVLEKESQVRELAGVPGLNVSSPRQLGEVIYETLALVPGARKPKSGNWPTDEQTLSEINHPIVDAILDFRGCKKLLSTYIDPFPGYVDPSDGRVHTTFNQTLTSTGRLSSSNPNLQNIPIRSEDGREIRKAFVAQDPDGVIISADYSQIELRIMAHLSGDDHLVAAFREGVDIHSATASKIFGVPVQEVTSDQRRIAKTANFGIMYGISAFGLSQRLKCPRQEARQLIEDYFASFPSIRSFIDGTLSAAREKGYVETVFGRRRYVPDLNSTNGTLRALAERNAVNAPIQGTAADIIKLAMIAVSDALKRENMKSVMVLQIHDELLLEAPSCEMEKAMEILKREMEGVVKLCVPLTVECNYGKTWFEAH